MSAIRNPVIYKISSSSDSESDSDVIDVEKKADNTESLESYDDNYYEKFDNESEGQLVGNVQDKNTVIPEPDEAGPSKINSSKGQHSTIRRFAAHLLSESDDSNDSVTCPNSPTNASAVNSSFPFHSPVDDDAVGTSIYARDKPTDPVALMIAKDEGIDEVGISKKRRTGIRTRVQAIEKSEKALKRLQERERKQQEKILAKALKDAEKEARQATKPGECIKSMRLSIDERLTEIEGSEAFFNILLDAGLCYSLEKNHVPSSIIWYRHIADVTIVDNHLQRNERDELENLLLLCLPLPLFSDLIYVSMQKRKGQCLTEQGLLEYVSDIKTIFPKLDITIVTIGLRNCLKGKSGNLKRTTESEGGRASKKSISKKDVDEVIINVQLQLFLNYKSLENCSEFGHLLERYTKAVAEAPFKKEKYQQQQELSWYAQADSSCPVKINKNGEGYSSLWQQQIQQFNLVGKDISQAIVAKFPSPLLLMEAYSKCATQKEAEKLLEDIIVRRDYGPLGTTRRVGPELSYKMFRFFTSTDGKEFLQR